MLAFVLCGLLGVAYHAMRLRSEALATHRTLARNAARLGEQQLTLVLRTVDRQLDARGADWLQRPADDGAGFEPRLRADLAGFPVLRSIAIVASDGRILASSAADARGSRLSAEALTALRGEGEATALRISRPWTGRDLADGLPLAGTVDVRAKPYFFSLARRLGDDGDGGFIVAVLNPDYLAQQMASLVEREEFVVSLSRYDGALLVSTAPTRIPPGLDQSREAVFRSLLPDHEIGHLDAPATSRVGPAILAYHASRLFPLVIQAHFDRDAVLADWRREMVNLGAMSIGVLCFIGVIGALVVRLQQRRERERQSARAELELAARVFDAAFDGIVITDREQRILRVNKAFTRITGYTEAEVRGNTPHVLSSGIHDEAFYAALWQAVKRDGRWQGEIMNRRRDGEIYPEELAISAVTDGQHEVCNYIGTFNDITERRRTEDALRSAKEAAETANRAKSQFLATISHEIRTPMNAILGMAQLLMLPGLGEAERIERARTILGAGGTLMTLLNDILDLARGEAGRLDLNPCDMSPRVVLAETAALFAEAAQKKSLTIAPQWWGAESEQFRADPVRLKQMLSNLLSNAIKYSAQGVVRLEGEVLARQGASVDLRFSVTDCGTGIPRNKLGQLFQPFSQLDGGNTRSAGGSGLGLSIVRSLALLMDGDVGVRSEPGHGSCFWFRIRAGLPAGSGGHSMSASPVAPVTPAAVDAPPQGALVLVVEDSPTNSTMVELMLQHHGFRVATALDGLQALDAIRAGLAPDIILMDCHMPHLDGFETTRRIRDDEAAAGRGRVPIVALTANAFEENRQACLGAGMDDFIAKPVVLTELLAALGRWLPRTEPAPRAVQ